jgi:hypothetical protein
MHGFALYSTTVVSITIVVPMINSTTNVEQTNDQTSLMLARLAGTTAEEFASDYAQGSLKAVSDISGVPASSIKSTVSSSSDTPASSSGNSRRLLQQAASAAAAGSGSGGGVTVAYSLNAADPAAASKGLQEAAADGGAGLYAALDANGVPLRPAVRLNGAQLVTQEQAAAAATAATSRRRTQQDRWPLWKRLTVGLCVGIGGGLILAMVVLGMCFCTRRKKIDKIRRHEAELVAADVSREPYPDALATAGGAEQQGKQVKIRDLG